MKGISKTLNALAVAPSIPENDKEREEYTQKYSQELKAIKEMKKVLTEKEKEYKDYLLKYCLVQGDKVNIYQGVKKGTVSVSLEKVEHFFNEKKFKKEEPELYKIFSSTMVVKFFDEEELFRVWPKTHLKFLEQKKRKPVISFSKENILEFNKIDEHKKNN